MNISLTDRQQREIEYHRERAERLQSIREKPVSTEVATSADRRWWNAYWTTYDILRKYDLRDKRVLIPGSGFGEDAVRVSQLGAEVHAFDISPDSVDIATERCSRFRYEGVHFDVMPSENLKYTDNFFDFILCFDILHHVNISETVEQFRRVLKKGGHVIGNELYTHRWIENVIRKNWLVDQVIYPRLVKYIYGMNQPYITPDEHKIDNREFAIIEDAFQTCRLDFFNIFVGRIVPESGKLVPKIDRTIARSVGGVGRYLAGRVLFDGVIRK